MSIIKYPHESQYITGQRARLTHGVRDLKPGQDGTGRYLRTTSGVICVPVFDPRSISGLKVWLAPTADNTPGGSTQFFTDTGGTTPVVSDGDLIAGWKDIITGAVFSQSTSGNRPTYKAAIVNGWPVGRYVGASSQYLDVTSGTPTAALQNVSGATVFSVLLSNLDDATRRALSIANNGTAMRIESSITTTQRANIQARALDGDTSSSLTSANNTFTKSAFHVRTDIANYAAATGSAWIDGANVINAASFSSMTAGNTSNTASAAVTIGWNTAHSAGLSWDGDIAEILLFNRALTFVEWRRIERWLGRKYGITIA